MNAMNKKPGMGPLGLPLGLFGNKDYILVSDFDQEATAKFLSEFRELEQDPQVKIIPIYIHSYGGDAHSLLAMRDIIKSSQKPVATISIGMAMSCGVLLLAAGTPGYRFAGPNTQIMIHEASSWNFGKAADIIQGAKDFERLNDLIYINFSKDTGIPFVKIKKKMKDLLNADWIFEPKEAVELGIIDVVAVPRVIETPSQVILGQGPSFDDLQKLAKKKKAQAKKAKVSKK